MLASESVGESQMAENRLKRLSLPMQCVYASAADPTPGYNLSIKLASLAFGTLPHLRIANGERPSD